LEIVEIEVAGDIGHWWGRRAQLRLQTADAYPALVDESLRASPSHVGWTPCGNGTGT